jgi:hypothetical protein
MRQLTFGIILALMAAPGKFAMAYEEAGYRVLSSGEVFELRRYEPLLTAEVEIGGDTGLTANGGFRILFDYISGENVSSREIAMTVPVLEQQNTGMEMERDGPLLQSGPDVGTGRKRFAFVLPRQLALDSAPLPLDDRVRIVEAPARTMAVRQFSGSWSERNYLRNKSMLLEAISDAGLEIAGEPVSARYNSPFTPWFLRRNEVMVETGEMQPQDPMSRAVSTTGTL